MNSLKFFVLCLALIGTACARSTYYEFIDTDGECWRCYSTFPCERCIRSYKDVRNLWNPRCPVPNCNDRNLRHILFPSRESNYFFQCAYHDTYWMAERVECQCNLLFDFESQTCVPLHQWRSFCIEINLPIVYKDCETGERNMIGERESTVVKDIVIEWH